MLLLRHGECASDYASDPCLTTLGRSQTEARAEQLVGTGIAEIVHSDKRRAAETAGILAARLGVGRLRMFPELREVSPAVLAESYVPSDADRLRAEAVCDELIIPWIARCDLLVVSHHNLLLFSLRRLVADAARDPFVAFGEGVTVFRGPGDDARISWRPLPLC